MDQYEKKRLRIRISEHIDVSGNRLTDDETIVLADIIDYEEQYRGKTSTNTSSFAGRNPDGKYIRTETTPAIFTEKIGIRRNYGYHDDDGQTGTSSNVANDARGMFNCLKGHS